MQIIVDTKELDEIKATLVEISKKLTMSENSEKDGFVSLKNAEKLVGVEQQTLRKMFQTGEIAGKRFGKVIRLSRNALLNCG
ncbi:hypothetical protein KKH82_01145 [Patescibacteria group bacterium]|nr:hypothetical protein [Patescibacteria group bacterium]